MPRSWRIAGPMAVAACGLLLVTSARAADGQDFRGSDHADLSDLVVAAEQRTEELSDRAAELTAEIEALTEEQASESPVTEQRLRELRAAAGLTAVEGPGVTVALDDANVPLDVEEADPYIVHQQDMEAVMNALWAGGAEAMMVMDQRVISTSAVRCIGPVLYLKGRQYAPPYEVTAIGDVDSMLAALDASKGVQDYRWWVEEVGLGFELTVEEEITIPAYEGSIGVSTGATE